MKEPPYNSDTYDDLRSMFLAKANKNQEITFRELMRINMVKEATEYMLKVLRDLI